MNRNLPLIAHLVFKLDYGGLENGLVNIINNYPENKFRHAIICLTEFTDFSERVDRSEVEIFSINKKPGKDIKAYINLYKLLKSLKPTILHTRNIATIEGQFWAFLAGVPIRLHGEHGRDIEDPDGKNKKYIFIRKIFSIFIQHFIALSNDLSDYLLNVVKINSAKISQIYNGVDTKKFKNENQSKDRIHDLIDPDKFIIIGTVGRLETIKDQLTLVYSIKSLLERHSSLREKIRVVIVGDGSQYEKIMHAIHENKLEEFIYLIGSKDNIDKLMKGFDIFVLPSLAEGISNTILEAMSTGLPVVATNVGGNAELVVDGSTGLLVPSANPSSMANALYKYIVDPDSRLAHGINARTLVMEKFSLTEMVNKYHSLYLTMLSKKGLS